MKLVKSLLPHRGVQVRQVRRTRTRREGPARGTRIRRWVALPACATLMLAGVASAPASADEEHVFCIMGDIAGETRYYSAVFLADYSWALRPDSRRVSHRTGSPAAVTRRRRGGRCHCRWDAPHRTAKRRSPRFRPTD